MKSSFKLIRLASQLRKIAYQDMPIKYVKQPEYTFEIFREDAKALEGSTEYNRARQYLINWIIRKQIGVIDEIKRQARFFGITPVYIYGWLHKHQREVNALVDDILANLEGKTFELAEGKVKIPITNEETLLVYLISKINDILPMGSFFEDAEAKLNNVYPHAFSIVEANKDKLDSKIMGALFENRKATLEGKNPIDVVATVQKKMGEDIPNLNHEITRRVKVLKSFLERELSEENFHILNNVLDFFSRT